MKYFIPYTYGLESRSKSIFYKLSFIILIILPILITVIFFGGNNFKIYIEFALAFTSMYSVYEIGYMVNDTFTTSFEEFPSYWLPQKERKVINKIYPLLISERVLIITIACYAMNVVNVKNLWLFIIELALLNILFSLHNCVRNRFNIVTNMLLQALKYCSVPVLFVNLNDYPICIIVMCLAVPLIRSIEFLRKKRFNIKWAQNMPFDLIRVIYYLVLIVVGVILNYFCQSFFCLVYIAVLLFLFRLTCYIGIKSKKIQDIRTNNFKNVK